MNGVFEMDSFRRLGNILILLYNGWKSGYLLLFYFFYDIFKYFVIYDL